MALLAPSSAEQGYIKTVLSNDHFMDLDSSSLALPSEDKLAISRQDLEKALRIQHQVQLTMARKTTKKSLANGSAYQDQRPHHTTLHRDPVRSPATYDTMKNYSLPLLENGWGTSHAQYGKRAYEDGSANTYSYHTRWGSEQDAGQSRPIVRRDISPQRKEVVMGAYEQGKTNTMANLRYPESRSRNMTTMRYSSRSEHGQGTAPRKSTVRKSTQSDQDSVFMHVAPISPGRPYYQLRTSRSMDNLVERRPHHVQPSGAVGQVQAQRTSSRFDTHQTSTKYTTYQQGYMRSASTSGGMDIGGKRGGATMTAAMAAAGNGNFLEHDAVLLHTPITPVGSAPVASEVPMTLERAVSLLQDSTTSTQLLTAAASYIQHECFQKAEARKRVYTLHAIPKLIRLLSNSNEDVQRAACAALRNLVYEDNDNKLEVCEQNAMPILLKRLKDSQDLETKKQITGLLWNLSSSDQLKVMLIRDALQTLNNSIIIPGSGWKDGEYSKNELMSDGDIFYNATGCLR
ncbi:hypothetical protein GDO78_015441 [Eleutherodactylus coqui]|uniref:Plakophilin 2 n=1 Tax=Eleutherodactylus coqui TaxID=57060 RepID=A0A8J6JWN5_ELECQ|nr:hypothetical protein GDO78_015441 [Eleutherodactylus coqui]